MNIRDIVSKLIQKHKTQNPFEIIKGMNVILLFVPLEGIRGFYQYFQRNNIIYINENLSEQEQLIVCAHELGHMILHKKSNYLYMDTQTNFNTTKYEMEANLFAIELLISDAELKEYEASSIEQLSRIFGYHQNLIELKVENYKRYQKIISNYIL